MSNGSYSIGLKTPFVARHFLIGGDWGPENKEHAHQYEVAVELEGDSLDEQGYLFDFVRLNTYLNEIVSDYTDALLNDLPEFCGLNPSAERLAKVFCETLASRVVSGSATRLSVTIWEKQNVWASYYLELG